MIEPDGFLSLIDHAAELLGMLDPTATCHHSRIAIINYSQAYRGHQQAAQLLESAYAHLERAVQLGANRERLEEHFYRIRQRRLSPELYSVIYTGKTASRQD